MNFYYKKYYLIKTKSKGLLALEFCFDIHNPVASSHILRRVGKKTFILGQLVLDIGLVPGGWVVGGGHIRRLTVNNNNPIKLNQTKWTASMKYNKQKMASLGTSDERSEIFYGLFSIYL